MEVITADIVAIVEEQSKFKVKDILEITKLSDTVVHPIGTALSFRYAHCACIIA